MASCLVGKNPFFFKFIYMFFFYFSPMMKGLGNTFIQLKGKHSGEETNSDVMWAEKVTLEVKEQAASASFFFLDNNQS